MSAPKALRDRVVVGAVFDVTNHYITREDHRSYGTTRRTVTEVNASAFYWMDDQRPPAQFRQAWPRASAVEVEGDVIRFYGGGAGQAPTDLFLTLTPVETP